MKELNKYARGLYLYLYKNVQGQLFYKSALWSANNSQGYYYTNVKSSFIIH